LKDPFTNIKIVDPNRLTEELSGQSPSNSGKNRRMKTVLLLIGFIVVNIYFAEAQQSAKIPLVGVLRGDSPPNPSVEAFQQAMRDLGYLEGRNVVIEYRYADG
jgi:hypothetical protein